MKRWTDEQLDRAHEKVDAEGHDDEERETLHEMVEAMADFHEVHGRPPTTAEFQSWWRDHCKAKLRKLIECVERQGTPVVYENGKYRILPPGTDLTRN
jgi:hypothetical protein